MIAGLKKSWFKVTGVELLLEYVDGKTLDEIEAPELGQLVLIFCQVSSALTHMHRRGVFHGDLKPANIMLTKNGQVKLIDFGTAWVRGQDKNRIQGTPQFIAPSRPPRSRRREDRHLQPRRHDVSHVHRPVCPAGHPQTGRRPQAGPAPIKVNPHIPRTLNELIIASLSLDPSQRPAGMFEIHDQFGAIAKQMGLAEVDLKGPTRRSERRQAVRRWAFFGVRRLATGVIGAERSLLTEGRAACTARRGGAAYHSQAPTLSLFRQAV